MTLTPAYGRDYKSAKDAKADFAANKDFIIADVFSADSGRLVNREQLTPGTRVNIRFKRLTAVTVVTV